MSLNEKTSHNGNNKKIKGFLERARNILRTKQIGLVIFLLLMWFVMARSSPFFLTRSNLLLILDQASTVAIAGVGMTFVIISGGVDLSVGGIAALSGMIAGICVMRLNLGPLPTIIISLSVGVILGFVNGVLISKFKLQPMISTLGTLSIARGLTLISTSGRPIFVLDPTLNYLGNGKILGIPVAVLIAILVFAVGHIILTYSEFGRYVYAIGGNEEATRLSGIKVDRHKIFIYMISGFCAALVGVVLVGLLGASEPTVGQGLELDAIAVTAIGGTNLMGGIGGVVGTVIGSVLIGTIKNSLTILNIVSYYQQVVIGVVIIIAVLLEYFRGRRVSRRKKYIH
jgi:ribose/xylose/arabinose/galactoside ABC-type transport system permease subunit